MYKDNVRETRKLALAGVFCALAYVCVVVFRFKVEFLTFDIKDAFIAVASMLLGPVWGVAIAFVTSLLEMISVSDTGFYGFVMNVLSTVALSATAGTVYKYNRNLKGAVIGLISGSFMMVAVMLAANLLITPFYYVKVKGIPMSVLDVAHLIPKLLLPFNIIKAAVNASLTMLIYKPVVNIFRRSRIIPASTAGSNPSKKGVAASMIISVLIIAVSVYILFAVLNGSVNWFVK